MEQIEKGFLLIGTIEYELGKILSDIKNNNKFYIASHIHSWKDYLKELGITFTRAQTLIDTYETFPNLEDKIHFDRMKDIARLYKLGLIKTASLSDIYDKAVSLTIKDWKDEYNMLEGKSSYLTCEHKNAENYIRCKDCGKWIKV